METTGITLNKKDKFLAHLSKWCLYSWIILSTILFFLVFNEYKLINYLTTIMITSLLFVPLYLIIFSSIFNKKIIIRIIKSIICLIPIIISYIELIKSLNINSYYPLIFIIILYLSLNYSMLISNSYIPLIIYTFINSLLFFLVNIIYYKLFNSNILLNENSLLLSILLIMGLLSMSMAFLFHTGYLLYYRRVN